MPILERNEEARMKLYLFEGYLIPIQLVEEEISRIKYYGWYIIRSVIFSVLHYGSPRVITPE